MRVDLARGGGMTRKGYSVDELPSGRFSPRLHFHDGSRERVKGETCATRDEADAVGAAAAHELGLDREEAPLSLATWGEKVLDRRELAKHRAIAADRSRFRTWIAPAPIAARPLRSITRTDVRDFVAGVAKARSEQTARHVLNLVRAILDDALERGKVRSNVAADLSAPSSPRTRDPWTYLERHEPAAIAAVAFDDEIDLIDVARGTGLRDGEQRALTLADVHVGDEDPHVVVRFGDIGEPTKTGRIRRVPLFGVALAAMRSWLERLPSYCTPAKNERRLVFPTTSGAPRAPSRMLGRVYVGRDAKSDSEVYVNRFHIITAQAGLFDADPARPLVWHSLRHTCASWLVSGYWGRRWTLPEVKEMLGHTTIASTERYAHLGDTALKRAAHEMPTASRNQFGSRDSNPDSWLQRPSRSPGLSSTSEALWEAVGSLREAVAYGTDAQAIAAAEGLARVVCGAPGTKLALEVLAGGPRQLVRALDLADVLEAELGAEGVLPKARGVR